MGNDVFNLIKQLQDKIDRVGTAPTDGEKDNLEKMVKDAVKLQFEAQQNTVRKSIFAPPTQESMQNVVNLQKRIASPAKSDLDLELQRFNDDILITAALCKRDPRSLSMYQDFLQGDSELKKALNVTNAGEGYDWVPTQFSADVMDKVRLELKVANLFQTITMPTNPYKLPVTAADAVGYLQSESLADDSTKLRSSQPRTSNVELSAKKLAARVLFSEETNEDSIVPVLPWLKNNVVIAIATAKEKALINGDTDATHQDSNVTLAYDAQKAWDGLRKICQSGAKVDISTFNADNLRSVRKAMGVYGVDPRKLAHITGISGYIQALGLKDNQNNPMVTTIDKYGPNATIITGELAKFDGSPIIVSEYVYQNLNASAVYDGVTTTKTIWIIVYTPAFVLGDRRKVTVKTGVNIETDQQILVCTDRSDFHPFFATTELMVGIGYNLAA